MAKDHRDEIWPPAELPKPPVPWWKFQPPKEPSVTFEEVYAGLSVAVGMLAGIGVFLAGWGYAIQRFGWFLGISLGWIPAAILGLMAGLLSAVVWPLVLLVGLFFWLTSH